MNGSSLYARAMTAYAFMEARHLMSRLKSREDIARWQTKKLRHFLSSTASKADAFADPSLRNTVDLTDYPTMDKAQLMDNFHLYNRQGVTASQAWDAFDAGASVAGCAVGCSTGTSGNRGLYLISNAERYKWLGVILAKALPDITRVRHRVAVLLPANSRLYDAANESGRLSLKFFDLNAGMTTHIAAVNAFKPTVIVAPPKVLRMLAEADSDLAPLQVFSGAEVLDPVDRVVIEARFRRPVREIYMATEGLFGVACAHGTMHLAEDHVAFEWEPDPAGGRLKSPLITDFTRRTQMMVRYRMNDLVELSEGPCPCGSPLQAVKSIAGRMDDVFKLSGADGNSVSVTPDIIRNTVVGTDRRIDDFRVRQTGPDAVSLILPVGLDDQAVGAKAALQQLFQSLGADPHITASTLALRPPEDRKLRRVERLCE